jgi:hypothetical protein
MREQSNTTCIVQNITDIDREIAEQKSQVCSLKLQQAGEGKLHFILACDVHASI